VRALCRESPDSGNPKAPPSPPDSLFPKGRGEISKTRSEESKTRQGVSSVKGYRRQDGRKGIRNMWWWSIFVECARHVAQEIAIAPGVIAACS